MIRVATALLCLLISGCAQVEIMPRSVNNTSDPKHPYTASTIFYSNNSEVPRKRMLEAAARFCQVPVEGAETRINWRGPYGLAGGWWLDFSCPVPPTRAAADDG